MQLDHRSVTVPSAVGYLARSLGDTRTSPVSSHDLYRHQLTQVWAFLAAPYPLCQSQPVYHPTYALVSSDRVVPGQVKVDEKSNETSAIPEPLDMLEVSDCVRTIDAMGCQKDISARLTRRAPIMRGR